MKIYVHTIRNYDGDIIEDTSEIKSIVLSTFLDSM
jgi:hypothetical protein